MKVKNIQTRLLITLLPLIFLIVGVLSTTSYYLSQQSLAKSVDETSMSVSTDYANRVHAEINEKMAHLEELVATERFQGGDKDQIVEAMAEIFKRLGAFDALIYIAPDGSGVRWNRSTGQYSDREYFKKVLMTKQPYVSKPLISNTTGKISFMLVVPVLNNDQVTGVVAATYTLDRLTEMMKNLKFLDTGYGLLATDSGMVIAHPKLPEVVGKLNLSEKNISPELKLQQTELDDRLINLFKMAGESGKQTKGEYTFVDGIINVAVFTPVDLPGGQRWIMSVTAPKAEVIQETDALARTMIIICFVCLIIAAVAIVIIAKRFAKPISLIRDECLLLAQGDLRECEAKIYSEDEIGQLSKGFGEMRKHLRELVTKVHSQSEQLAAASEELTASAEESAQAANQVAESISEVANGAEKQVNAIDETSAVVDQMSTGIQQVAVNSNLVAGKSSQAAEMANEGSKSVEKAISQMTQIEQTVNNSAQVVVNLGERSKEIGQIVDIISGIAGQTNLLALNAAIEAARAGEQGLGFAVVADEVRKLAEQSQDAAKQIAVLITEIKGDTDKAISAMSQGTHEVEVGTEVVTIAGRAFGEIAVLVTEVFNQVKEISTAIQQMASGSQQIVSSVKEIDGHSKNAARDAQTVSAATEEQSASMEEIAASSQSLAKLAQDLQEAVSKFRV
jgi:methyl-accepting chemotaxis protein